MKEERVRDQHNIIVIQYAVAPQQMNNTECY